MIIYKNIDQIKLDNIAVAIGMFDGIHRGHLKIIDKLKRIGLKSCIISFDINDNKLLYQKNRIISDKKKIELLSSFNIDYYICPIFDEIKNILAKDFVKDLLIEKLDSKIVISGEDFKFGWNRLGNIELLKKWLEKYNRNLYVVETRFLECERISSSNIRIHIKNGKIKTANTLLGRNFSLDFDVSYKTDDFLFQEVAEGFICPPNGKYLSILKKSDDILNTYTIICNRVAKTYYTGEMIDDDISIELVDKIG